MLTRNKAISKLNQLGTAGKSFSFYCDFLGEQWCIEEETKSNSKATFQFSIGDNVSKIKPKVNFRKIPICFSSFKKAFDKVVHEINIGNSFLTNLTFQTPIETNLSLKEIFDYSKAKYKLLVPNQFVVFSPETFVKIKDGIIYSYPMKGTIDAHLPNAKKKILENVKEKAEHVTVIDLIRNDLSQVARDIRVTKFRYTDKIQTNDKNLLQVSSEIAGSLQTDWKETIGIILSKLLPAGSISGAPKGETIRIITENENYKRGFYTGICGHFNGHTLDTGVMIRFIKKINYQFLYYSGGGITSFSEAKKEYREMIDKIYLAM